MHILCILDLQIGFRIKPVIRLSAEINPDLFISTSISPRLTNNGSHLKNPDISDALYTLKIQFSYTQCEDGARDVRVL